MIVLQKLNEIINIVLENKNQQLLPQIFENMNLQDDIGFDSLDLAELTVRIENEFGIDIFDSNFE